MIRKLKGLSDIFVKSLKGLMTNRILESCQAQQNPNFNSAWLGLLYSSLGDSSSTVLDAQVINVKELKN